eukprot:COSAG06_NODE_7769_length_2381_cov_1.753287_2_plen_136_part_00
MMICSKSIETFGIKMILLPRQARDTHRESTPKKARFVAGTHHAKPSPRHSQAPRTSPLLSAHRCLVSWRQTAPASSPPTRRAAAPPGRRAVRRRSAPARHVASSLPPTHACNSTETKPRGFSFWKSIKRLFQKRF